SPCRRSPVPALCHDSSMQDTVFGQVFEHSSVGIATFSVAGRFLSANPALRRLLGYTQQELLEKTHLDVIHVDDLEAASVTRVQVIAGKAKPRIVERRYLHKDGSTLWTHASGCVIRDESGAAQYRVVYVIGISKLTGAVK